MSVSVIPSSTVALIEKAVLAELNSATSTPPPSNSTATNDSATAITQLTRDFAALLKDLAAGNVNDSKTAIATLQQDLKTQTTSDASSRSPLDNLLTQISNSLNSTDSTTGSLHDLATYLIQNDQGTGSTVNTAA